MTETEKLLIHCLKAFGVKKGAAMEISLRMETEKQQKELLNFMADNRTATPETLLANALESAVQNARRLLILFMARIAKHPWVKERNASL